MERQIHGFIFEDKIKKYFNLQNSNGYTSEFDGYLNNIPVSIKTKKENGELCLGDCIRILNNTSPTYMFIGEYETKNLYSNIYCLFFPNGTQELFDGDIKEIITEFKDYMLNTDNFNNREYDNEWLEKRQYYQKLYKNQIGKNNYILLRPKRDHKKQRRLQCAIPNRYMDRLINNYCISIFSDWDNFIEEVTNN